MVKMNKKAEGVQTFIYLGIIIVLVLLLGAFMFNIANKAKDKADIGSDLPEFRNGYVVQADDKWIKSIDDYEGAQSIVFLDKSVKDKSELSKLSIQCGSSKSMTQTYDASGVAKIDFNEKIKKTDWTTIDASGYTLAELCFTQGSDGWQLICDLGKEGKYGLSQFFYENGVNTVAPDHNWDDITLGETCKRENFIAVFFDGTLLENGAQEIENVYN